MKHSLVALISALILSTLSGCAVNPTGNNYAQHEVQRPQRVNFGVVHSVREVAIEERGMAGSIVGGVVGAVVGSTMGGGKGNTLMTILGGVGGAVMGSKVDHNARSSNGYEITVRLGNGEHIAIVQDKAAGMFQPGQAVRIVSDGRTARVVP